MGARTLLLIGVLAAGAGGCGLPFRVVRDETIPPGYGKSFPAPLDNPPATTPTDPQPPAPPPGVVPARGQAVTPQPAPVAPTPVPPPGVPTLPAPKPLPGSDPGPLALPPGVSPAPGVPFDYGPHVRGTPTVAGDRLNLAPWESPLDRVGELSRKVDWLATENQRLAGRLLERDALGAAREQALAEAMRERELAVTDTAKAKADAVAAQFDTAAARAKLAQFEKDDVEFLRKLVEGLTEVVNPPREKRP